MSKSPLLYGACMFFALVIGFVACEEEDVGPGLEIRQISRLYVSFEEYGTTDERADTTIRVIQPADSSVFTFRESHLSQVQGGGPIYFNPYVKTVFQASVNSEENSNGLDTVIAAVSVQQTGLLNNAGNGIRSRYYNKVRGFVYHAATRSLLVVNGAGANAGIYVVDNPSNTGNQKQPYKKLVNPDLDMWGAAYQNDRLFTAKISAPAGLYMFQNLTTISVRASDSVATLNPTRTFRIEDASTNLRGLSYDTIKNVLAIAEMGDGTTVGSGRILLFDNFSNSINGNSDLIRPSRVITGSNTGLISPVDVAIDTRASGVYLYVADRAAKKVSRFRYTDEGNVEPEDVIDTSKLGYGVTPVGLALDARDDSTLGQ
ncbi:hypothetical protein H8B06_15005 [Sphingobacterium sp. DN00404]|uniref:DUF4374 domain-containing protein n=1 Tax=Sphingobacterium micropteri TaxID=2763501 RepID=A0ABR7YS77_9SPHI|nr:hypothetical protein [Sphingobacterium micropteri]MBD1434145.1 hypothetical protein [Sphingobacterium micropteri]